MASTYRRSFPPATGPACVSWFVLPGRALMLREMREKCVFVSYCFSVNYEKLRETLRGAAGKLRVILSLQVVVCKSVKYHLRKKRVKNQVTARAPARATRTRIYRRAFVACGVILSAARVPVAIGFFLWPSSARLNSLAPGQNRRAVFLRYPAPLRYA